MFRLLLLLVSVMFVTLLIGGRDFGQQRYGLRDAPAPVALAARTEPAPVTVAADAPKLVAARYDLPPVPQVASLPEPVAPAAAAEEAAVFSLAPFADQTKEALPDAADASLPLPDANEAALPVRYVSANAINVRQGPSTSQSVIGRLTRGEAVSVVRDAGDGWVQVRMEGDGIDGYVAARLLTATEPTN